MNKKCCSLASTKIHIPSSTQRKTHSQTTHLRSTQRCNFCNGLFVFLLPPLLSLEFQNSKKGPYIQTSPNPSFWGKWTTSNLSDLGYSAPEDFHRNGFERWPSVGEATWQESAPEPRSAFCFSCFAMAFDIFDLIVPHSKLWNLRVSFNRILKTKVTFWEGSVVPAVSWVDTISSARHLDVQIWYLHRSPTY